MSKNIKEYHLNNFQKEQLVFWTKGNEPTQKVYDLDCQTVMRNLKLLYLLSDKIIASASYYFESPITQEVTKYLRIFFNDGSILYFIDDDLEDPTDHAKKKMSKVPKEMSAYSNKTKIIETAKEFESTIGVFVKRPNVSISNKIVELWINDVLSTDNFSIGSYLTKELKDKDQIKIIQTKLIDFAQQREKDFVWEYIKPFLKKNGLKNERFHSKIQKKLTQMYAYATANILGIDIEESIDYININRKSKYDVSLFAGCLCQLGILDDILNLSNIDLNNLKHSLEFALFRDFYFKLIDDLSYDYKNSIKGIVILDKFSIKYKEATNREEFIKKFIEFKRICNYPKKKFWKNIDNIKYNIDSFNINVISDLQNYVKRRAEIYESNEQLITEFANKELKIYAYKVKEYLLFYMLLILAVILLSLMANIIRSHETFANIPYINEIAIFINAIIPIIILFINGNDIIQYIKYFIYSDEKNKIKKEFENLFRNKLRRQNNHPNFLYIPKKWIK